MCFAILVVCVGLVFAGTLWFWVWYKAEFWRIDVWLILCGDGFSGFRRFVDAFVFLPTRT